MRLRRAGAVLAALGLLAGAACQDDGGSSSPPTSSRDDLTSFVALAGRPAAVVLEQDGDVLWVADDEAGLVRRLSLAGAPLGDPVAVSPHPGAMAIDGADLWVVDPDGTLTRLDVARGEVVSEVDVGGVLVDVLVDGGVVWVADIEAGGVRAIDPGTEAVGPLVVVPGGAVRMAAAGPILWVTGLDDVVTPVDLATGTAGPAVPVGRGPIGAAVDADGVLWVAVSDDDVVARLDGGDGSVAGPPVPVGGAPVEVVVHGDDVWVLDQESVTLTRLSASTGQPRGAPVALSGLPRALVADGAGVWVAGVDPSGLTRVRR